MRAVLCLAVLVAGTASHALTFQFLLRSSRTAVVETRFEMGKRAPNGDLIVVGRAGQDLLVQRWDANANLLLTKTFDGPDRGSERVVDVDVDNLNATWVLYDTGAQTARLVRFDLNLNIVFDIATGLAGETTKKIIVNAAREGIYSGVGVDARDTFVTKVTGAGTQKWRQIASRLAFGDADLRPGGDGIVLVGRNTTTQQGVVTAFRNLDGVRPFTFETNSSVDARNAILQVATNRVAGEAFAMGLAMIDASTKYVMYRIAVNGVTTQVVSGLNQAFPMVGLETAQAVESVSAAAVANPAGGGIANSFDDALAEVAPKTFGSPSPKGIAVDRLGGGVFIAGDRVIESFVPGPSFIRLNSSNLNSTASYSASPGVNESLVAISSADDNAATALASDTQSNQVSGALIRMSSGFEWRVTNQIEQHPTRRVIDSATDGSGAHYTLVRLGTIQQPSLIIKRSSTGQEIWQTVLADEGALAIQPRAIAASPNGSIIVAGIISGQGDIGTWIVQSLNPLTGAVNWKRTVVFPAGNGGNIRDLAVSAANEILVTGTTVQNFGSKDMATARLLGNGTVRWTRVFGGAADDVAKQVAFHPNGGAVVWGLIDERLPRMITYSPTGAVLADLSIAGGSSADGDFFALEPDGTAMFARSSDSNLLARRLNPLTGTILSEVTELGSTVPLVVATADGKPWVLRRLAGGTFRASRLDPAAFVANLDLPPNTFRVSGGFAHTDNSVVFTGSTQNPTTFAVASYIARHLPSGARAALRNFAGDAESLVRAPDGSAWASGDQRVQNFGTEPFMAKYTVP